MREKTKASFLLKNINVTCLGILAMISGLTSCDMLTGPDNGDGGYEQPTDPVEITSFTVNNQSESNQAYHNSIGNFDFDVDGDWDTVSLRYRIDDGEWFDQDINSPLVAASGKYDFEVRAERNDEVDFSNITAYVHNLNTSITDALSHMADGSLEYSVSGYFNDVFGENNWVLNVYREWADDINVPNAWTGAQLKETVTDSAGLDSLLLDQPGVYVFEVGRRDGSSNSIDGYAQRIATGLKGVNDAPETPISPNAPIYNIGTSIEVYPRPSDADFNGDNVSYKIDSVYKWVGPGTSFPEDFQKLSEGRFPEDFFMSLDEDNGMFYWDADTLETFDGVVLHYIQDECGAVSDVFWSDIYFD